jgi:hypothetical protein
MTSDTDEAFISNLRSTNETLKEGSSEDIVFFCVSRLGKLSPHSKGSCVDQAQYSVTFKRTFESFFPTEALNGSIILPHRSLEERVLKEVRRKLSAVATISDKA